MVQTRQWRGFKTKVMIQQNRGNYILDKGHTDNVHKVRVWVAIHQSTLSILLPFTDFWCSLAVPESYSSWGKVKNDTKNSKYTSHLYLPKFESPFHSWWNVFIFWVHSDIDRVYIQLSVSINILYIQITWH